ncbi:hypothetical protein [Alysiella filiformis]|nr:hypothetical protein [Alysiella filiformis]QMT32107.1 hypothetical protein H3L97_04365 [Alysiella filiformis]UBQ56983.1 hypothetical protein JF568_04310 [Alysiella filiformis DSM 16848]
MNMVSLKYNRGKIFRFALICAAAALGSVGGLYGSTGLYLATVSWLGVILFGVFSLPALLWLAGNRKTQVTVSPEQIVFHMKVHVNRKVVQEYAVAWHDIAAIRFSGSLLLLTLHDETAPKLLQANFALLQTDWAKFQTWLPQIHTATPEQRAKLLANF